MESRYYISIKKGYMETLYPGHVEWLRQQEWFPRFTIFLLQRERMEYYYFHDVIPSKYLEATEFINALRIFLKQEGIRNVTV